MNDKLGPITDFVTELKTETRMTQAEEIELFQTLEFASRDVEPGELQDFVVGVKRKILDSRGNKGIEKGIDLAEVRKAAMKTSTELKEEKRKRQENNGKVDGKEGNFVGTSKDNYVLSEDKIAAEFNIEIEKYISSSFPDLAPGAREALKQKFENGRQMKDEFAQECEECKKSGKNQPSIIEFFNRKSKESNISTEALKVNWLLELGLKIQANRDMTPEACIEILKQDSYTSQIDPERMKAYEEAARISRTVEEFIENTYRLTGETPPQNRGKNVTMVNWFNEFMLIPHYKFQLNKEEDDFRKKSVETAQHFQDLDGEHLPKLMIEKAKRLREVNITKMEIASLSGEKNPVISDELRKAIIEEYMKGEMPVAKIFEMFREKKIVKDYEVTAYDFIDVVAQELESKNMSEETCLKFISNEEEIADELYEMKAREYIRSNTENKSMVAEEYEKNNARMGELRSNIATRSGYSARFVEILRERQDVKGEETRKKSKSSFSRDKRRFENIALSSTTNTQNGITFRDKLTEKKQGVLDFLRNLRKSKVTTQDVEAATKEIAQIARDDKDKTVSNEPQNTTPIQVEEIHTGDQQDVSKENDTGDR